MSSFFAFILITALCSSATQAQTENKHSGQQNNAPNAVSPDKSNATPGNNNSPAVVVHDKSLLVELGKTLDAKNLKTGDEVIAKISDDVLSGNGTEVLIRKGAKLVGHVTEAQAHSKDNQESRLGIVFDRVILHDGKELLLHGLVQGYFPPTPLQAASTPMLGDVAQDRAAGPYIDSTTGRVYQGNPYPRSNLPPAANRTPFSIPIANGLYLNRDKSVFTSVIHTVKLQRGAQVRIYAD